MSDNANFAMMPDEILNRIAALLTARFDIANLRLLFRNFYFIATDLLEKATQRCEKLSAARADVETLISR